MDETKGVYASVGDALASVLGQLRIVPRQETIHTKDSYGRVAALDLKAPTDVPSFATSHMDGFAVRSDDLRHASPASPARLKVKGSGRLGAATSHVARGEAARIATGGRLPQGSDAVLPMEAVEESKGALQVTFAPKGGDHVYPAGGDVRRGETIVSTGRRIRAQDVGFLLALGYSKVRVRRRPRVSIIATGSELSDSETPPKGKIRNSHTPVFLRLWEAQGCLALDGGVVPDDEAKIRAAIRRAVAESDLVMTLGGTSVGRHDAVGDAVKSLRPSTISHGLKMDRGRVAGVAVVQGKPVLIAPGPIQGALNSFILLGVPILRYLVGSRQREFLLRCKLGGAWTARKRFANFQKVLYVRLSPGEQMIAEPILGETESMKVLSQADGYVWVPEGVTQMTKGSEVSVRLLPGFSSTW